MPTKRYAVLVGVDFSKLSDRAFAQGLALASLHDRGELHVLHAISSTEATPPAGGWRGQNPVDAACSRLHTHVQLLLEEVGSDLGAARQPHVTSHVRVDNSSPAILQIASDLSVDLIVLGTHGREGLDRWLMGSVSDSVARHARCPVVIVPPHEPNAEMLLEPPCSDCVLARQASGGRSLWCARHHQERAGRRHDDHSEHPQAS